MNCVRRSVSQAVIQSVNQSLFIEKQLIVTRLTTVNYVRNAIRCAVTSIMRVACAEARMKAYVTQITGSLTASTFRHMSQLPSVPKRDSADKNHFPPL